MISRRSFPMEGRTDKGGLNTLPSQITKRPPAPASIHRSDRERPEIDIAKISLRHDLPLINWTVIIRFRDRPDERLPVQARDPLSAVRIVNYTSEREWSAEKLLAVESIHPVQG